MLNHKVSSLKIDTTDRYMDSQTSYASADATYASALLYTPLLTVCESRRGSIASSQWSFASYTPSASSFQSSQDPITPPSQEGSLPLDFSIATSGLSFEDLSTDRLEGHAEDPGGCFQPTPLPVRFHAPKQSHEIAVHSDTDWEWIPQMHPNSETGLRITYQGHDGMMPASGDFSSALESSLAGQQAGRSAPQLADTFQWSQAWHPSSDLLSVNGQQGVPYMGYDTAPSSDAVDMQYGWTSSAPGQFVVPLLGHASPTVAPTETFVDTCADTYDHAQTELYGEGFETFNGYSSDRSFQAEDVYPTVKVESREQDTRSDMENDNMRKDVSRGMSVSSTGAKGIKRERTRSGVAKRRHKTKQTHRYYTQHNGTNLKVEIEPDISVDVDGKFVSSKREAKELCLHVFENGAVCRGRFARQEHLKRHRDTHTGRKEFPCRYPDCKKLFNRNDNLREHFKTHITVMGKKVGRNDRTTFDRFCAMLRQWEDPETAEKTIGTLSEWKDRELQKLCLGHV